MLRSNRKPVRNRGKSRSVSGSGHVLEDCSGRLHREPLSVEIFNEKLRKLRERSSRIQEEDKLLYRRLEMKKSFSFEFDYESIIKWLKRAIKWFGWDDEICGALMAAKEWAKDVVPDVDDDVVEEVVEAICDAIIDALELDCPE